MLIQVSPNLIVNIDTIVRVERSWPADGGERTDITLANGTRTEPVRFSAFERATGAVIAAPAGYFVIEAHPPENDGGGTSFTVYPVLAFRLTDREPEPITPLGEHENSWAIVWPDGRCDDRTNRIWASVEEYKASFGNNGAREE